jgi:hypothetical protein
MTSAGHPNFATTDRARQTLLAADPTTATEVLGALATHDSWRVRAACAHNPNTSSTVVETLSSDVHHRVRVAAARRLTLSSAAFDRLAHDRHQFVRQAVAMNRAAPVTALVPLALQNELFPMMSARLAGTRSLVPFLHDLATGAAFARWLAASHPSCRPEVLSILATDIDPVVRAAVAWNPATPPSNLRKLARDDEVAVVAEAAGNPSTPHRRVVRMLRGLRKPSVAVARQIAGRSDLGAREWLRLTQKHCHWSVRARVAENPMAPLWVLALVARWPEIAVRDAVATHSTNPLLLRLLTRARGPVRFAVARNPAAPPNLLRRFAGLPDPFVRLAALTNPAAPIDLVTAALDQGDLPAWALFMLTDRPDLLDRADELRTWVALGGARGNPKWTFDSQIGDPGVTTDWHGPETFVGPIRDDALWHVLWSVRRAAMGGGGTITYKRLQRLASDPSLQVRQKVLGFQPLTTPILTTLADDPDRYIAHSAQSITANPSAVTTATKAGPKFGAALNNGRMVATIAILASVGVASINGLSPSTTGPATPSPNERVAKVIGALCKSTSLGPLGLPASREVSGPLEIDFFPTTSPDAATIRVRATENTGILVAYLGNPGCTTSTFLAAGSDRLFRPPDASGTVHLLIVASGNTFARDITFQAPTDSSIPA